MTTSLDSKAPSAQLRRALLATGSGEGEVAELLNGYARELAQQIRREARQYGERTEMAMGMGAAVIDPFTSSGGEVSGWQARRDGVPGADRWTGADSEWSGTVPR